MIFRQSEEFGDTVSRIERTYPELDGVLVTASQQHAPSPQGTLGYLQQDVVRKAVYHGYQNHWLSAVPRGRFVFVALTCFLGLVIFITATLGQFLTSPFDPLAGKTAFDDVVIFNGDYEIVVEPGNVEIEKGTSLLVLARFPGSLPPEATLFFQTGDGQQQQKPMSRSLDDPVFGSRISDISETLQYWVQIHDRQSTRYTIDVFEYPKLDRLDVKLTYPEFTQMGERVIQDVTRVTMVEGTRH